MTAPPPQHAGTHSQAEEPPPLGMPGADYPVGPPEERCVDTGDDLAEFLLARNTEDGVLGFLAAREEEQYGTLGNFTGDGSTDPRLNLIRRFSTARLRLETAVHRQIIDLHRPVAHGCAGTDGVSPCPTLRLLALPFVDHPAYRQEWRP